MAITVELPPEVEASLEAQARARGLRLDAEDVKQGRTYGPFDSAGATIKFLRKEISGRQVATILCPAQRGNPGCC